jgi:glycosyltransferase involved in cell wall biosynthesis
MRADPGRAGRFSLSFARTGEPMQGTSTTPADIGAQSSPSRLEGRPPAAAPEVSVVMPCLNEADTVATCVDKARQALADAGIAGEVIVSDNGSADGSQALAESHGARVVHARERGYGNALMAGIEAARGRYVVMGDADDSYDWRELPRFVDKLRDGYDLVQGCRLERGGGTVLPGAMPFLHRVWGNPMFSALVKWWFKAPINDVNCGMRGFSKRHYESLHQTASGMEFAVEMVVKSSLRSARIAEVPITLHPDGRASRDPHLRTFRDGWRTLRFFLLFSPRWLFLVPGLVLIALGLLGFALAMPAVEVFGATLDANTLLFSSLAIICGYQSVMFAVFAKVYAISHGLLPADPRLDRAHELLPLERVLVIAAAMIVAGLVLLGLAVNEWRQVDFGRLDYSSTVRLVVPGMTLTALGFQTMLSGFMISILNMRG